jgi:hypothetical protein
MGINLIPSSVSPIRSLQRGVAVSAGDITISSVNTGKTMINAFSTGASGSVAITGSVTGPTGSTSGSSIAPHTLGGSGYSAGAGTDSQTYVPRNYSFYSGRYGYVSGFTPQLVNSVGSNMTLTSTGQTVNAANITMNSQTLTGGSTSLVAATNGAYLKNSTTITVTGPCRYEIVEYY